MRLGEPQRRSKVPLFLVLGLFGLAMFTALGTISLRAGDQPKIQIESNLPAIGMETDISIKVSESKRGVEMVRVYLVQNKREVQLGEVQGTVLPPYAVWSKSEEEVTLSYKIGRRAMPEIREGKASIVVYAQPASTWLNQPAAATQVLTLPVRLKPPRIDLMSRDHFVTQGGAGAVRYRVGKTATRHGVTAGKWFFPGYQLPGAAPGEAFAFFAVPYDHGENDEIKLFAIDDVQNESSRVFLDSLTAKPSKKDKIKVSDRFMSIVVPRIKQEVPEMPAQDSLVEEYVWINRELRKQNDTKLKSLAATSTTAFLWNQRFMQMPAKVFSSFADHRSYIYEGREIDQQYHLGYDLASVKQADIPAANTGRVVMAEYLGIYGKTVVLDHGFGIMTLYGHMSSIDVQVGDMVTRGKVIGKTGATGLALGDHLHFSVLIHGLSVRPLEWWDGKWINNRIASVIGDSLNYKLK